MANPDPDPLARLTRLIEEWRHYAGVAAAAETFSQTCAERRRCLSQCADELEKGLADVLAALRDGETPQEQRGGSPLTPEKNLHRFADDLLISEKDVRDLLKGRDGGTAALKITRYLMEFDGGLVPDPNGRYCMWEDVAALLREKEQELGNYHEALAVENVKRLEAEAACTTLQQRLADSQADLKEANETIWILEDQLKILGGLK